jgi:AraC family transcriptional activator FtrA
MLPKEDSRIARVVAHVRRDLTRRITLADAAKLACLEPLYFSKCFRKTVGTGFAKWNARLRVEAANNLLSSSNQSVTEIAAAVGYKDLTTFERAFRRVEATCPRNYRSNDRVTRGKKTGNAEEDDRKRRD